MLRTLLKSKIHRATVTEANLEYMGSITLPKKLMKLVDLWQGEQVLIVSNTSGHRLWTYAIEGKDEHNICMNGASAHLIKKGEQIIIMAFAHSETPIKPKNVLVDDKNNFVKYFD
ncbi:MAG: aspartate 1-decarboxylase [Candidatus Woesearchaeota archaeon]|jgi:aspartate 1-decarboxylase